MNKPSLDQDQPPPHVAIETLQSYDSKNDHHHHHHHQESGDDSETRSNGNDQLAFYTSLARKAVAEAVGCFIVVISISAILESLELMGIKGGLMEYATASALSVISVVIGMGSISGAHINPAVTIAFVVVGSFPKVTAFFYVVGQVGGCVLGSLAGKFMYGIKVSHLITKPTHGSGSAFSAEFIATAILVFLAASLSRDPQSTGTSSGFVMGAAIALGVILTGSVSGGSMNPARSLGPAIVTGDFDKIWIYLIAPTLGAIFGGVLYRGLRLQGWSCHSS